MPPEYRERIEAGRPRLNALAQEQYGVTLQQGPFGIDSRPALIGAKFAEARGLGAVYHKAVMDAYWLHAQDIGDIAVLADLAAGVGLDRGAFLAALVAPVYDKRVQADVDEARAVGINSVPALVFVQRYLVSGAQPYPVLTQVVEQVLVELAQGDAAVDP